jgi:hypothetical protein
MNTRVKQAIYKLPVLGKLAHKSRLYWTRLTHPFNGSAPYWEQWYAQGGTSGDGSYGRLAEFKAEILNALVAGHGVESVIEWGCGDGNQLSLARYPSYLGLDVSKSAVARCQQRFRGDDTKTFMFYEPASDFLQTHQLRADLSLSLDVIYHLVEDAVFETYMASLFDCAERLVVIYSSNEERAVPLRHVRHRRFDTWIAQHRPAWSLLEHIPNRYPQRSAMEPETSHADFFIFGKTEGNNVRHCRV